MSAAECANGLKMAHAADAVHNHVVDLTRTLDAAHRQGLAVPQKAANAVQVLAALAVAWDANSSGQPAPEAAKAALGLIPTPSPRGRPTIHPDDGGR